MENLKYVITGQLGQIGRELKKRLDLEHKCVGVVDTRGGQTTETLSYEIMPDTDVLFHLAANCVIRDTIREPELAFSNLRSTFNTLEFCKNNNTKFVYFSSSRVLSKEKNPYTASKIYGEELTKAYSQCYGIEYQIIRPSTVYGGQDDTGRLIETWTQKAKKDKDLVIFGNKHKTLNFTHIDDFVSATMTILDKGKWNKDYNVYGISYKLKDVAEEIITQTKSKSRIIYRDPEISQPQDVSLYDSYLESLGYNPRIRIKEGIRLSIENGK